VRPTVLFALTIILVTASAAIAQFPQSQRIRDRMDQSIKASSDREHDRRLDEEGSLPAPRPAVMNVDVQIVLSKGEHKTFAEAKAAETKRVSDGEPLWLYMKFKSRLGDYVVTTRHPDDREKLRFTIFAELAPRGDITTLHQYAIRFAKEDLGAKEFKISLAPGMFGPNRSIPVFLLTSGGAQTGVWNNEFRLTNNVSVPRTLTENLASAPITLDFSAGTAKYRKMDSEYDSIVLRGTTDLAKLPVAGTFFSADLAAKITSKLAAEKIVISKLYFSGDDWEELASFKPPMSKTRRLFATFTYRRGDNCFYGVAEVVETYDFLESKFGEADIKLQKDLPAECDQAN
jgi:hypothetical protein